MNCDECKHYEWYYDRCKKWECEIDARAVHNCFERRDTPIRNMMVNPTVPTVYHSCATQADSQEPCE